MVLAVVAVAFLSGGLFGNLVVGRLADDAGRRKELQLVRFLSSHSTSQLGSLVLDSIGGQVPSGLPPGVVSVDRVAPDGFTVSAQVSVLWEQRCVSATLQAATGVTGNRDATTCS